MMEQLESPALRRKPGRPRNERAAWYCEDWMITRKQLYVLGGAAHLDAMTDLGRELTRWFVKHPRAVVKRRATSAAGKFPPARDAVAAARRVARMMRLAGVR